VHRSSPSIASLAAALAKAQAELVNPEKSLTATIRSDERGRADQTFRYASLSSGLDIVRKTLGQHEIATVQTTAIDQTAGVVNLTTLLAHASGEWIASDWPVCAVSETATPRRMGAALTYARRYALFTLVGIAGEDDVDAPDLLPPEQQTSGPEKPKGNSSLNGGQHQPASPAVARPAPKTRLAPVAPALGPEASAQLRDRLLGQLKELTSGDDAALWAHRSLPEKNKLIAADALRVEESFQAKVASFATSAADEPRSPTEVAQPLTSQNLDPGKERKGRARSKTIDKSVLTLPEPRRVRDREHVPKAGRWRARSAMSSPCRCVEDTIARFIAMAMKRRGGRKPALIRQLPPVRCGSKRIRWRRAWPDCLSVSQTLRRLNRQIT